MLVDYREIVIVFSGRVAPYKKLRGGIAFVDQIPRNPSGKILRRILRTQIRPESKL